MRTDLFGGDCLNSFFTKATIPVNQYTNAKDSHGAEMFVNDTVLVDGLGHCTVKICPLYGVVFVGKDGYECPMVDSMMENDTFKVVGNVYQNKELIK